MCSVGNKFLRTEFSDETDRLNSINKTAVDAITISNDVIQEDLDNSQLLEDVVAAERSSRHLLALLQNATSTSVSIPRKED